MIFQAPSHFLKANANKSFDQLNNRPVCIEDTFLVVSPKRGNTTLAQSCKCIIETEKRVN